MLLHQDEDVVQDSFIKVFSGISKFEYRGEGALQAWLLRIVTNEAVNFVRQQKRFTIVDEVPDDIEDEKPEVERVPPAVLTRMIGELPDGLSTACHRMKIRNDIALKI